nr:response regulator [Anaerolineae bacterium]
MATILVIDDDSSLLQMMSLMLKRAGHEPILAANGHEGIQMARTHRPDLAVIDVMMPDINGFDVCRTLRGNPGTNQIPLLVLTALAQPEQQDMALESGADDFITKPVTRDDLTRHVDELLASGPRTVLPPEPPPQQQAPAYSPQPPTPTYTAPPPQPSYAPPSPPQPTLQPAPQPAQAAHIPLISVIGLRPGVGATTLAVNIAIALIRTGRTCLLDLNTTGGQLSPHFGITTPRATWLNLMNVQPGDDKRTIGSALSFDQKTGVAIIAAPTQRVDRSLHDSSLGYILEVLAEGFSYTIADLSDSQTSMAAFVFHASRYLLLVIDDDPAKLHLAAETLRSFEQTGADGQMHIVLNHTRPHGIPAENVIQTLNRPLSGNIPYAPEQIQAFTQGLPLTAAYPDSLFARSIIQLTTMF